ncbi:superoxide dismutase family protein [Lysobacter antibioticus]|uniref:superoxide dismutase family protein n=1 Tax=Lysobacter antibioticus TaxID=84531 RepID=UPI000A7411E9|nr:superoxide dismutase family protein [Lysobacter antibioticus]
MSRIKAKTRRYLRIGMAFAVGLAISGCGNAERPSLSGAGEEDQVLATVALQPASGSSVKGHLSVSPNGQTMAVAGTVTGLTASGVHAIHIHEKGDCSAADASSAGDHFNPYGHRHGSVKNGEHHVGDMENIVANAKGEAIVKAIVHGASLGGGGLNDIGGRALVIHAMPDDYASQPSGKAGKRIACGVLEVAQIGAGNSASG